MYLVGLSYQAHRADGKPLTVTDERWTVDAANAREAVDRAQANVETAMLFRLGAGYSVVYLEEWAAPVQACGSCRGTGRRGTLEGWRTCPVCDGRRYIQV